LWGKKTIALSSISAREKLGATHITDEREKGEERCWRRKKGKKKRGDPRPREDLALHEKLNHQASLFIGRREGEGMALSSIAKKTGRGERGGFSAAAVFEKEGSDT